MKNMRRLLYLGLLAIATTLMAQDTKIVPHRFDIGASNIFQEPDALPSDISTLYSNLGPRNDRCDMGGLWTIAGSDWGPRQSYAAPYTASADSTIYGLQLAVFWSGEGANEVAVAVFDDADGVPGNELHRWNRSNLAGFGSSCQFLLTVVDKNGIKVNAGTQYWVVVGTDAASTSSLDGWFYTYDQVQGMMAENRGNRTWDTFSGTVPAFAIYGTIP